MRAFVAFNTRVLHIDQLLGTNKQTTYPVWTHLRLLLSLTGGVDDLTCHIYAASGCVSETHKDMGQELRGPQEELYVYMCLIPA